MSSEPSVGMPRALALEPAVPFIHKKAAAHHPGAAAIMAAIMPVAVAVAMAAMHDGHHDGHRGSNASDAMACPWVCPTMAMGVSDAAAALDFMLDLRNLILES